MEKRCYRRALEDLPASFAFGEEVLCSANGNAEFDSGEPFNSVASQIMDVAQTDSSQIVWK
jgi:hypothetical protein